MVHCADRRRASPVDCLLSHNCVANSLASIRGTKSNQHCPNPYHAGAVLFHHVTRLCHAWRPASPAEAAAPCLTSLHYIVHLAITKSHQPCSPASTQCSTARDSDSVSTAYRAAALEACPLAICKPRQITVATRDIASKRAVRTAMARHVTEIEGENPSTTLSGVICFRRRLLTPLTPRVCANLCICPARALPPVLRLSRHALDAGTDSHNHTLTVTAMPRRHEAVLVIFAADVISSACMLARMSQTSYQKS